jgi:hypothetical protein
LTRKRGENGYTATTTSTPGRREEELLSFLFAYDLPALFKKAEIFAAVPDKKAKQNRSRLALYHAANKDISQE